MRSLARLVLVAGCALAYVHCGESGRYGTTVTGPTGPTGSSGTLTASIAFPGGPADTIVEISDSLKFTVSVTDASRVASLKVEIVGLNAFPLDTFALDSTVSGTVAAVTRAFAFPLPINAAGQRFSINVTAKNGSNAVATVGANVTVDDRHAPLITVLAPTAGVTAPNASTLIVVAKSADASGIARMGARLFTRNALQQPVAISGDSLTYAKRFATRVDTFRVVVPSTLSPGSYPLQVFAVDSSPNKNTSTSSDITITVADTVKPFGNFLIPATNAPVVAGDSVTVRFRARDSIGGVVSITLDGVSHRGVDSLGTGVDVTRYNPVTVTFPSKKSDTTFTRILSAVASDSTPETVFLRAVVTDVGGNVVTIKDTIVIVAGPFVHVGSPASGARVPVGVPVAIKIVGRDPDSVRTLGFVATGVATGRDSVVRVSPLKITDSVTTLSLPVSASAPLGVDTITPFATDRLGNRFLGQAILISFQDTVAPTDTIKAPLPADLPVAAGDSVLVTVRVLDNRGVSQLSFLGTSYRGSVALGTDIAVSRFTTRTVTLAQRPDTTISRYLRAVLTDSTPERVYIIVQVQDSSGNTRRDSTSVVIVNGPKVVVQQPADSSQTSPGKSITIQVRAIGTRGVRLVGWSATGVVTQRDSTIAVAVAGQLADTLVFSSNLSIPVAAPSGSITVTPFAIDSLGNVSGAAKGVTIIVSTVVTDVTPPLVQFTVGTRVEVSDTITVRATDPSGIARVGFIARNVGTGVVIRGDSLNFAGNLTNITQNFGMNLSTITSFPTQVTVEGFAIDAAGNRGVSTFTGLPRSSPAAQETLTVVAGKTIPLPLGSRIGDAIFNKNRNELYLTNTTFDRIEVYSLASNSIVATIPVGSRPVGIALWPHDTLGNYADTVIVANTGGTNLSIVDVAARVEVRRQRLPTYGISQVSTTLNAGGGVTVNFTPFGFSSRPFQVATACIIIPTPPATAQCTMVRAVYSSSPTPAQTIPDRGYMAWIDLNPGANPGPHVHFVYEHANQEAPVDTIEITASFDSLPNQPLSETVLGAGIGVRANLTEILFRDSTYVRNSGDFRHLIIGEGGPAGFARVLLYAAGSGLGQHAPLGSGSCTVGGMALDCTGTVDSAVSPEVFVSDFVINRASRVSGVATNFNGRTNVIRADSIYAFDFILRQTGMMQVSGAAVGMDFHPSNTFDAETRGTGGFGGVLNQNNRLLFAARPDSTIDVFDTYFYGRVTDTTSTGSTIPIPIRNALIGPVRVAAVSGTTTLFGITAQGLVAVQLPVVTNSLFPIRAAVAAPVPATGTVLRAKRSQP